MRSQSQSQALWCFYELCRVAELFQCVSISRIFCGITIAVLLKWQFQHSHISYPVTNDHKIHILWIHKIHSICHACLGQVNLEICDFTKLIILQFWIYPKLSIISIKPTFVSFSLFRLLQYAAIWNSCWQGKQTGKINQKI